MANRVTYEMVKQWLSESWFAQEHKIKISSWNGYYHIQKGNGDTLCSGDTPKQAWQGFCLYRDGYYLRMEEKN